ncbi:uncharacterized protein MONOS_3395 [Monocercomonoides exilis]|uniref:uncharacterized protein n=1 Tax=Monocercomonoides exilis TaxID=2049356 RepID=UPI003559F07B|nr:hypothetical protein MONOS_3395 [Monocercomonoides exilis]|eukprot:MONOS_3395.1-p1 / transcript=MONOS_3395.1 / gene=MONOS_3395 / organism=Monocercomonoides_exilis_PA203 / gene_product=unspecified product / transcript_product=unspecified product / location=Mono_scaffold00079:130924-135945(+) / protein_length=1674 / sequence_SO=supercontig / SO=protein_coding / is_pseudo=false
MEQPSSVSSKYDAILSALSCVVNSTVPVNNHLLKSSNSPIEDKCMQLLQAAERGQSLSESETSIPKLAIPSASKPQIHPALQFQEDRNVVDTFAFYNLPSVSLLSSSSRISSRSSIASSRISSDEQNRSKPDEEIEDSESEKTSSRKSSIHPFETNVSDGKHENNENVQIQQTEQNKRLANASSPSPQPYSPTAEFAKIVLNQMSKKAQFLNQPRRSHEQVKIQPLSMIGVESPSASSTAQYPKQPISSFVGTALSPAAFSSTHHFGSSPHTPTETFSYSSLSPSSQSVIPALNGSYLNQTTRSSNMPLIPSLPFVSTEASQKRIFSFPESYTPLFSTTSKEEQARSLTPEQLHKIYPSALTSSSPLLQTEKQQGQSLLSQSEQSTPTLNPVFSPHEHLSTVSPRVISDSSHMASDTLSIHSFDAPMDIEQFPSALSARSVSRPNTKDLPASHDSFPLSTNALKQTTEDNKTFTNPNQLEKASTLPFSFDQQLEAQAPLIQMPFNNAMHTLFQDPMELHNEISAPFLMNSQNTAMPLSHIFDQTPISIPMQMPYAVALDHPREQTEFTSSFADEGDESYEDENGGETSKQNVSKANKRGFQQSSGIANPSFASSLPSKRKRNDLESSTTKRSDNKSEENIQTAKKKKKKGKKKKEARKEQLKQLLQMKEILSDLVDLSAAQPISSSTARSDFSSTQTAPPSSLPLSLSLPPPPQPPPFSLFSSNPSFPFAGQLQQPVSQLVQSNASNPQPSNTNNETNIKQADPNQTATANMPHLHFELLRRTIDEQSPSSFHVQLSPQNDKMASRKDSNNLNQNEKTENYKQNTETIVSEFKAGNSNNKEAKTKNILKSSEELEKRESEKVNDEKKFDEKKVEKISPSSSPEVSERSFSADSSSSQRDASHNSDKSTAHSKRSSEREPPLQNEKGVRKKSQGTKNEINEKERKSKSNKEGLTKKEDENRKQIPKKKSRDDIGIRHHCPCLEHGTRPKHSFVPQTERQPEHNRKRERRIRAYDLQEGDFDPKLDRIEDGIMTTSRIRQQPYHSHRHHRHSSSASSSLCSSHSLHSYRSLSSQSSVESLQSSLSQETSASHSTTSHSYSYASSSSQMRPDAFSAEKGAHFHGHYNPNHHLHNHHLEHNTSWQHRQSRPYSHALSEKMSGYHQISPNVAEDNITSKPTIHPPTLISSSSTSNNASDSDPLSISISSSKHSSSPTIDHSHVLYKNIPSLLPSSPLFTRSDIECPKKTPSLIPLIQTSDEKELRDKKKEEKRKKPEIFEEKRENDYNSRKDSEASRFANVAKEEVEKNGNKKEAGPIEEEYQTGRKMKEKKISGLVYAISKEDEEGRKEEGKDEIDAEEQEEEEEEWEIDYVLKDSQETTSENPELRIQSNIDSDKAVSEHRKAKMQFPDKSQKLLCGNEASQLILSKPEIEGLMQQMPGNETGTVSKKEVTQNFALSENESDDAINKSNARISENENDIKKEESPPFSSRVPSFARKQPDDSRMLNSSKSSSATSSFASSSSSSSSKNTSFPDFAFSMKEIEKSNKSLQPPYIHSSNTVGLPSFTQQPPLPHHRHNQPTNHIESASVSLEKPLSSSNTQFSVENFHSPSSYGSLDLSLSTSSFSPRSSFWSLDVQREALRKTSETKDNTEHDVDSQPETPPATPLSLSSNDIEDII